MQCAEPSTSAARRPAVVLLFLLFFLSGFAALLDQVIWQRLLALFSGVDVYSVTIIVAAFMAGLGIGSVVGGYLADRLSDRRRLLLFAAAELAIALFALASKWLYYDVLYMRLQPLAESPAVLAPVLFLSLLWPTFCMGLSLPLLAKSLTRQLATASSTVGALYGTNTLGAGVGAFAAAWWLIPALGFGPSLQVSAALNVACALGALAVIPRLAARESPGPVREAEQRPVDPVALSFRTWALVYALSGFIALSLEIVWFRLLGVITKPSAFTFANLLGLYISGVALGTFAGIAWARRSRAPARSFFLLQAAVPIYVGLSLVVLLAAIEGSSLLAWLRAHLAGYEAIDVAAGLRAVKDRIFGSQPVRPELWKSGRTLLLLYFVLPALLVLPPTLMMGMSFPLLQRVVQTDARRLGRRVGWLQTANIAGSMAGAIVTGWLLLDAFGSAGTLRVLIVLGGVFLLLASFARGLVAARGRLAVGVAACSLWAACLALAPSPLALWAALHGVKLEPFLFAEDATGLSALKTVDDEGGKRTVAYVNGLGQSWIPFGGIHTRLGLLPAMLHPDPQDIAVIGLGSGDTLFAAGGRPETRTLTCFELIGSQRETLVRHQQQSPDGGLGALLDDPRVRWVVADGRAALAREGRLYDVIEADALRPTSAYAGNLYSEEYFTLLKEHLKPGGLAVTWCATQRTRNTFLRVFPHVVFFDPILVGSNEPIRLDPKSLKKHVQAPSTQEYYRRAGIDVAATMQKALGAHAVTIGPDSDLSAIHDVNSDLYPRDEYLVPQPESVGP